MANYGLKYVLSCCDAEGLPLRIEIHQKGYTGASIPLTGTGDAFVVSYKEADSLEEPISSSSATINIVETGGFNYADLYSADERTFRVYLYVNNIVFWTGWLLPDFIQGEYKQNGVVSISATDTLGTFDNIPYLQPDGSVYTGRQRLLDVIVNCLRFTDLDLDISVLNGISSNDWSPIDPIAPPGTARTILTETYINSERFSDSEGNVISCYDILESVMAMIGSTLRQEDGRWSVFNIEQRAKQIGFIDTFNPNGGVVSRVPIAPRVTTIGDTSKDAYSLATMTERIEPVYYNTEIYSEHGPYMPLIKNIRFNGFASGIFPDWVNVNGFSVADSDIQVLQYTRSTGAIYTQKQIDVSRPVIRSGIVRGAHPALGVILNVSASPYMRSTLFPVLKSEQIVLTIDLEGFPLDRQYVVIKVGDYYLGRDYTWTKDINKGWIEFQLPEEGGRQGNTRPYAVQDTFEITTSELPESGDAEVRIYGHDRGGSANYQMSLVSLDIKKESANIKVAKGIVFSTVNPGYNTYIPERRLTLFSDYVPSGIAYSKFEGTQTRPPRGTAPMAKTEQFLSSILTNREGEYTEKWSRLGRSESAYLNTLASRSVAEMHGTITKSFQGDVRASGFSTSSTFLFDCNGTDVFLFTGGRISVSKAVVSGTWTKVNLNAVSGQNESVYASFDGDDKSKGTGVSGIGAGGSGSGGGATNDTLQTVTDRGATTTHIVEVAGIEASDVTAIPSVAPGAPKPGKTYVHFGDIGSGGGGGQPPSGAQELRELDDVSDTLNPSAPNPAGSSPTFLAFNNQTNKWEARQGNYIPMSQKGQANGVATLGTDGILAVPQRPPSESNWDEVQW